MYAILITWVAFANVHSMSVEHVPVNECKARAAEALKLRQVQAVLCTMDGLKVNDAVNVGECIDMPEMNQGSFRVYYCNGSVPRWN